MSKLPNYFKSQRRKAGLSQDDVAFLLGGQCGAHVSRYEHFRRMPSLRSAMAYEFIFNTQITELLAGEFEKVEKAVSIRAMLLTRRLLKKPADEETARKISFLRVLLPTPKSKPRC